VKEKPQILLQNSLVNDKDQERLRVTMEVEVVETGSHRDVASSLFSLFSLFSLSLSLLLLFLPPLILLKKGDSFLFFLSFFLLRH